MDDTQQLCILRTMKKKMYEDEVIIDVLCREGIDFSPYNHKTRLPNGEHRSRVATKRE